MNPMLLNYLAQQAQVMQPQQQNQGYQQSPSSVPMSNVPAADTSQNYNPFDSGVRKAIESAQTSLSMTRDQENRALRKAMLQYGNTLGQIPRERGFVNNLLTGLQSLGPAVGAYDEAEAAAQKENNDLANQILAYQAQQRQAQERTEDRAWNRDLAERQFAENRRYHDLSNAWHMQDREGKGGKGHATSMEGLKQLNDVFSYADKEIDRLGEAGQRNRVTRISNKFLPGGERALTAKQAAINTLDETLRGKLFNLWGYRAQNEFNHVPHISVDNPPEVNKAIIEQIKNITKLQMGLDLDEMGMDTVAPVAPQNEQLVRMKTPHGKIKLIRPEHVENARADGLVEEK